MSTTELDRLLANLQTQVDDLQLTIYKAFDELERTREPITLIDGEPADA